MLNTSELQFLEAVQGWMAEAGTRTYLTSNNSDHLAGSGTVRVSRMSEELKTALVQAGVELHSSAGGTKEIIRDNLVRRMMRDAANDGDRRATRLFS